MRSKLTLLCIVATISLFLFACSPAPKQVSIKVSGDDFMKLQHISKEAQVPVDGSLTVTLYSNPTTGFQWELTSNTDEAVLGLTDRKFVPCEERGPDGEPIEGAAGKEVWTFKALKGVEPNKTFTLTVVVKLSDTETTEYTC